MILVARSRNAQTHTDLLVFPHLKVHIPCMCQSCTCTCTTDRRS